MPIARESCSTLSVADFYAKYMLPNQPVLIDISAMTALWRVRSEKKRTAAHARKEIRCRCDFATAGNLMARGARASSCARTSIPFRTCWAHVLRKDAFSPPS